MFKPHTVLSPEQISLWREGVERRLKARKAPHHGAKTAFDSCLLATLDAARAEADGLRLRVAALEDAGRARVAAAAPDRSADTHARRADEALRRMRRALEAIEPALREAAKGEFRLPGPVLQPVSVQAPARLWWELHQAWLGSEPWPLELLGPVQVLVTVSPTEEAPSWSSKLAPALFTRGHHHHEAFVMHARSAARERGLPRPMLKYEPISAQVNHQWWTQTVDPSGRACWAHISAGSPAAVPVTVWSDPVWEGGAAPSVAT